MWTSSLEVSEVCIPSAQEEEGVLGQSQSDGGDQKRFKLKTPPKFQGLPFKTQKNTLTSETLTSRNPAPVLKKKNCIDDGWGDSLISPIIVQGCAARQGMVFYFSVQKTHSSCSKVG